MAEEMAAPEFCVICGAQMVDHHCWSKCPNCGYKRDCSDPFDPWREDETQKPGA